MSRKIRIKNRWKRINRLFTILIITIVSFTILRETHIFFSTNAHYNEQLLEYKASVIEQEVRNRIDEVYSINEEVEEEFFEKLEDEISRVDHFAMQSVNNLDVTATLAEKRDTYIETIYQYDLSEDDFLFFSFDVDGIAWLLGLDKTPEQSSILSLVDPITGEYIVGEMIDSVMLSSNDDSYYTYYWPKIVGGEAIEKTSYLYYNSDVELIIGTGMYFDDHLQIVKDELVSRIDAYYRESDEYVFIIGYDGSVIQHGNPNFDTEELYKMETNDGKALHSFIVSELEAKESVTFQTMGPDIGDAHVEKFAYVQRIEGWDAYIGQSFDASEITISSVEYMKDTLFSLVITIICMIIIASTLIYILKKLINRNFIDVEEEFIEQNEIIAEFSLKDFLTGLYNRSYFDRAFNKIQKSSITSYSLIQGDANGLKLTNDAYGHHEGDKLLVSIATLLTVVFEGDQIFRWGGDEFVVLSKNGDKEEVKKKLKLFQAESIKDMSSKVNISVSFGYAIATIDEDPYEKLKIAEKMMYERKTLESSSIKRKIIDKILETLYGSYNFEKQHSENVMKNALLVGEKMGLNAVELGKLRLGALMHDIGKIGIPDALISKPGRFTDEEYDEVKKHSEKGFRILSAYPELSEYGYIVLHHHEHFDGSGYPMKLAGEKIPLYSRIITIVDAFDAMIEERVYKQSMTEEDALQELVNCKSTHFDPDIVDIFIEIKRKQQNLK